MNSQAGADVPLCNAVVSQESVYLSEGEGSCGGAIGIFEVRALGRHVLGLRSARNTHKQQWPAAFWQGCSRPLVRALPKGCLRARVLAERAPNGGVVAEADPQDRTPRPALC